MKRFELTDFASSEGVWIYLADNDAEAEALTNLPQGATVICRDCSKTWRSNSTGTPTLVGGGGTSAPALTQHALAQSYPFGGTPATLTPTAHGATTARVFGFDLPGSLTCARVLIRTNAAVANSLRVGLFNSTGQQVWTAGPLATVAANWLNVTTGMPLALAAGTYYWATTNNAVVSTTAAYTVTPATGAALTRWGTVPTTLGAMPASINPAAITSTTGGWMTYVLLSAV